ncbi:TPA: hypothetical protein DIV48_03205 [Candidatus Kaiserbacteria bacterium]|nr:hypothetical protein [Candidatus Kaiserbacteria bacterium]
MGKRDFLDWKRILREQDRLTRPPRLEGKVKNAMMNPVRKKKKQGFRAIVAHENRQQIASAF